METNTNAPKSQGQNPTGEGLQQDCLIEGETANQRICRKAEEARAGALEWLIKGASGGQTYAYMSPARHAAFNALKNLAVRLSLLGLQARQEGPSPVEPECEQTLDEIIRLLAVLNDPDKESDGMSSSAAIAPTTARERHQALLAPLSTTRPATRTLPCSYPHHFLPPCQLSTR